MEARQPPQQDESGAEPEVVDAPVVAVGNEQQPSTDWLALGVAPPQSAADRREAEPSFIEQLHRPRTEAE